MWNRCRICVCFAALGMLYGSNAARAAESKTPPTASATPRIRVAAYNVMFGGHGTAEEIGKMFSKYNLDVIGFSEVPAGDWTARVGKVLDMKYSFVGKTSSANHKDKYKSILSRTPLREMTEIQLPGQGWNPASAVFALTDVPGCGDVAIYSLHICGNREKPGKNGRLACQAQSLVDHIRTREHANCVIAMGDYNNCLGDPALDLMKSIGMCNSWCDLNYSLTGRRTYSAVDKKTSHGVIDHIYYRARPGLKATDGGIIELERPLSDHTPISAELTFCLPH
jgi:maltose 6'-phosphate phosphatase